MNNSTIAGTSDRIKITKPQNCLLGWSLPLNKEDYNAMIDEGTKRDFIQLQLTAHGYTPEYYWKDVYGELAMDYQTLLKKVETMGVTVKRKFALSDLEAIYDYEVFSIFAHYSEKESFIELADGLIPKKNFIEALPPSFKGIYDLTACNSVWLRDAIKEKYPNQVIAFSSQLSATLMLVFYKNLICNINKYDMNYIDCYTKMIVDLNAKCDE